MSNRTHIARRRLLLLGGGLVAALVVLAAVYLEPLRLALMSRESAEGLRRAASRSPHDELLVREAARRLLEDGRPAEARSLVEPLAAAQAGDPEVQVLLARALVETGETGRAGELLKRLLEERPEHAEARFWLAEILSRQGYEDLARDLYEEVTRIQPGHGAAWERAGELRLKSEHYAEALKRLDEAERLRPTAVVARLRGAALRSLGKTAEAEAAVRQAVQRDPADPLAHYALGDLLQSRGGSSLQEAREHLETAVRLSPSADNLKLLAVVCRRQSDHRAAVASLRRMIELAPAAAEGYLLLGQSYQAMGRRADASRTLAIYRRLEPLEKKVSRAVYRVNITRGDPASQAALARVYLEVGRQDLARATLEKLRRRDPAHPDLPQLERRAAGPPTLKIPALPPEPQGEARS